MLNKLHPGKDRADVALQYVNPDTSPITKALWYGSQSLSSEGEEFWAACFAYNVSARSAFIRQIWQSTIPVLAPTSTIGQAWLWLRGLFACCYFYLAMMMLGVSRWPWTLPLLGRVAYLRTSSHYTT